MTNNLEIAKINAAVDLLIESDVDLSNALGKDGLIKQLSKRILERALEAEMDNHLVIAVMIDLIFKTLVTVILSRLSLKRSKVE
jgi:hypothetical protein